MSVFTEIFKMKSRDIVMENETAFALLTNIPIVLGHVLICPIREVQKYEELTEKEKVDIEKLRVKIISSLEKSLQAEGFNFAWNDSAPSGQSVPHFHLHVVPRKIGDANVLGYEPRQYLYRPPEARPQISDEELKNITKLIKNNL